MNRVKAYRLERGLSQHELASATSGVWPRWKIQLTEAGHYNPNREERMSLAQALNLAAEELFGPYSSEKGQGHER